MGRAYAILDQVVKSYADKVAVDDLSFSVAPGEIFGLIGPNGVAKTSTIRMMMDIWDEPRINTRLTRVVRVPARHSGDMRAPKRT